MPSSQPNPFERIAKTLDVDGTSYKYYSLKELNDPRVENLPYTIRVLLESALRNADEFVVKSADIENILNWTETSKQSVEIPFLPARVILQDFTGVPCVVDLAAMRDAVASLGGNPKSINPLVPVDLVVDHSVQVDSYRNPNAVEENLDFEMKRNAERFQFLKWGATAFNNLQIVPPGSGIVHQVNLEYLARVVFANESNVLYPDSLVGTDSHTTMINGLGVTAWGVGGIEAEAVMLGQHVSMVLPEVVGFYLSGSLPSSVSATDLVLQITSILRKHNVVGKFVEFYGPGIASLSLADRATIANMAPEYGATQGFFPFDQRGVEYLRQTGRSEEVVKRTEAYLRAQNLFLTHNGEQKDPIYTSIVKLDLSTVVPTIAGPKRPHDAVFVSNQKKDFNACLTNPIGFKGYDISPEELKTTVPFEYEGKTFNLTHGSVVIAAITSCTNTSNPSALIAAGLLARNAIKKGLQVRPYIKTSLAPGSHVATKYLEHAGLTEYLDKLGFNTVAFGCTTCIGNSGDIPTIVEAAINNNNLVASAVLSGNRNFEGRIHPSTRANYLASPALVVAYALAGTVDFDFETEPLTYGQNGQGIFLRDIWPSKEEIAKVENESVLSSMFKEVYKTILNGTSAWNSLKVEPSVQYKWDSKSTYIHNPPYFQGMGIEPPGTKDINRAYCLLNLGDSITTDHISPAGKIAKNSPAAVFLQSLGVAPEDFNSYGSRRGNDLIMMRGTFANTRIVNKLLGSKKASAKTLYVPEEEEVYTYDAAEKYKQSGVDTIVFGGQMYGSGSSRDWAAKGPFMLGVRSVIAQSFERIHRSNLVGMGLLPLEFMPGESADTLGLTGKERYTIDLNSKPLAVQQIVDVTVTKPDGSEFTFQAKSRIDTEVELEYFKHGGILNYVIRKILKRN